MFLRLEWELRHARKRMPATDNLRPLLALNAKVNIALHVRPQQRSKWRDQRKWISAKSVSVSQCCSGWAIGMLPRSRVRHPVSKYSAQTPLSL